MSCTSTPATPDIIPKLLVGVLALFASRIGTLVGKVGKALLTDPVGLT